MLKVVIVAILLSGCDSSTPSDTTDGDADGDIEGDAAGDADAGFDGDSDDEGEVEGEPGAATLLVTELLARADRACDLDDDGALDNAIADLGEPQASLYATVLSQTLLGFVEGAALRRLVLHIPRVDDLWVPESEDAVLISFRAEDTDHPEYGDDDFSGDEPFYAHPDSLSFDGCAEPAFYFEEVEIAEGQVTAEGGAVPIPRLAPSRNAQLRGQLFPGGLGGVLEVCGYMLIQDLGRQSWFPNAGDLNHLEVLLAGGEALGVVELPGLMPDMDLDGDGLERFLLDEHNAIATCIDGDGTLIEGRDCWQDSRVADAISMTLELTAETTAQCAGPAPFWRAIGPRVCEGYPLESSLWGPCSSDDSPCVRGTSRECETTCGAAGFQECLWDCSAWGPCRGTDSESWSFDGCDDITTEPASLACDSSGVRLVDGLGQFRGVRATEDILVGSGPVTIEARVNASLATTELPADGWAIVAYLNQDESWLGEDGGWFLGIDYAAQGYALEWRFYDGGPRNDPDNVVLRSLVGTGEVTTSYCFGRCDNSGEPGLDSSTEGTVQQGLGLVITPDVVETPEDEMSVTGYVIAEDGTARWMDMACYGAARLSPETDPEALDRGCPMTIWPGDRLTVGLTGSTGGLDAVIDLSGSGRGLRCAVGGPCPEG